VFRIRIISPGKDKQRWITLGCEHYQKLISRFADIELIHLADLKSVASLTPQEIMVKEAEQIRKRLTKGPVIALDVRGKSMDSKGFARSIAHYQARGPGQLTFLIGGAYGLDDRLLKEVEASISLSSLTFSHQLVRLVFVEQLYRALSILHATPYHK
jgi:23S rRNA (pseudouridine1915-N3)-methyltransferase